MHVFKVGELSPLFAGKDEGVYFDVDNGGALLALCYADPDKEEIAQIKAETEYTIRVIDIGGVMFILAKFGTASWIDVPYNPHLSGDFNVPDKIEDGAGLALQVVMADMPSGAVKAIRVIGLDTETTRKLFKLITKYKAMPFLRSDHDKAIEAVYDRYTTEQLVHIALTAN